MLNKFSSNNLFKIGVCSFSFLFSLGIFLESLGLGIISLSLLGSIFKSKTVKYNPQAYFFSCFFLVYLAYLPCAYDIKEAFDFLGRFLPVLFLPFLIMINGIKFDIKYFMKYFIVGATLAVLYCMIKTFFLSFKEQDYYGFFYYAFASNLSFHPTYFALIVLIALIFLNYKKLFKSIPLVFFLSFLFVVTLLLLQVRSALLVMTLFFLCKIFTLNFSKKRKGFILIGLIVLCVFFVRVNEDRFSSIFKISLENKLGSYEDNGVSQRIWLWKTAIEEIKNKPILGHGLLTQRSYFYKKIHKDLLSTNVSASVRRSMLVNSKKNLHNQYLQWLYDFGLLGSLILLISILFLVFISFKKKNFLFLICFGSFLFMMLTENLLDRQPGIYFYSVVLPLIFITKYED